MASTTMILLPAFIRRNLIRLGRDFFAPRAIQKKHAWPKNESKVSLHMVVGTSMLQIGLLALRSWEFHTQRSWDLFIHEDGTFSEEDHQLLLKHFPAAKIIPRKVADDEVTQALENYPICQSHRMNHNWFLKVFDTRYYAPNEKYILLDSDIIFFKCPSLILDWADTNSEKMWIMEDDREKYSHPRSEIESAMGMTLVERGNSGLDLMPRAAANPDLAEKFLATCANNATQYEFLEQTIFSLWVSAWNQGGLLPREEYEISWNNFRNPRAVCRHYIGSAKNDALFVEGAPSFWWQQVRKPSQQV